MNTSLSAPPPNAGPEPGPSHDSSSADPPPTGPTPTGPRVSASEVGDLGRLRRTLGPDRKVAGVAGGLARHLDVDPVVVRIAMVVLVFFGGIGLVLYLACWLLTPPDGVDRALIHLEPATRSVTLKVVGGVCAVALLAGSLGHWGFPTPVILATGALLILFWVVEYSRRTPVVTAPAVPHQVDPVTGQVAPVQPAPTQPAPVASHGYAAPAADLRYPARVPTRTRRGPVLFWYSLALATLGCGALLVATGAGAAIPYAAYPALVLGCAGAMLLVGSVWGRAGGLVPLGLVAALALLVAGIVGPWHGGGLRSSTPDAAADVRASYQVTTGKIVLDLTRVTDPQALAGRTVRLDSRAGQVTVLVPAGLAVTASGEVRWAGDATVFDRYAAGTGGVTITDSPRAATPVDEAAEAPLRLVATVGVGQIDITTVGSSR